MNKPGGEFGTIPVDSSFSGQDSSNPDFWYFNGTPVAVVGWAFEFITSVHFGIGLQNKVDLVVLGPNESANAGPFLFTASGTIGAAYYAVELGTPAVAFSAGNTTHRSFTTNTGLPSDPANLAAQVVAGFVAALSKGVNTTQQPLLPLGIGVTVEIPVFGPATSDYTQPPFVHTRMNGDAWMETVSANRFTGIPAIISFSTGGLGVNQCVNGDCTLPGMSSVTSSENASERNPEEMTTSSGCNSSVTFFTTDYDAPTGSYASVQTRLDPLFGHFSE